MRGTVFALPDKSGLTSHICHENYDEGWPYRLILEYQADVP
jgi:hypothetical protein